MGSPNPVSASTMAGRSVTRAICPARWATSVSVVSPMSGSASSLASTAPEMYRPWKPCSSTNFAEIGVYAPGNWTAAPGCSSSRSRTRFCAAVSVEYSIRTAPPGRWPG